MTKAKSKPPLRNYAMAFCFRYSNGEILEKYFLSSREARDFANGEGDHCLDWWAGRKKK